MFVIFNQVEIGVIYSCIRDELYTARRGSGAFRNGKQIHCSGLTGSYQVNKIRSIRIQKTLDSKTRTGGGGRRVSQGKLRYTCASCLRQKFLTAHRQLSSSSSPKRHPVQVTKIKCGTKFLRVLIFVIFPAIGKNKIYANKNYRRQTEISYTKKQY